MADTQKVEERREQTRALEDLARTRLAYLKPLGPAEIKLLHAAAKGLIAFCGPSMDDHDPENDPHRANWTSDRNIRAEVLRWLLIDPEAVSRIDPSGLTIHAGMITGTLDLSFVSVRSPLRLLHCRVTDVVNLSSTQIPELSMTGSLVRSINATAINVKGDVSLNDKFMAYGEVILAGAQIGHDLYCQGGTFWNLDGDALEADGIDVKGAVFLGDKFMAVGEVRLPGAQIGHDLSCAGGTFKNPGRSALDAEGIDVKGNIFLNNNFMAEGKVQLTGAEIRGDLSCDGGTFKGGGGSALEADRINVKGGVFLWNKFMAEGEVRLVGAQIGGSLWCDGGAFTALNAQGLSVAGILRWASISNPKMAKLDLRAGTVGSLVDDKTSWPAAGKLFLDGFSYRRIEEGPRDAQSRLRWLALQKDFATQPYRQLAKVMSDGGDEKGARQVLFEMERRQRSKEHGVVGAAAAWDGLLRFTVGYGYYPENALFPLLGLGGLGWIIYRRAKLHGAMAPTDKEAYQSFKERQGEPPPYYRKFSPLVYSIENCLPLVNLGQASRWAPDASPQRIALPKVTLAGRFAWLHAAGLSATQFFDRLVESPTFLQVFVWIQIILGWLLALFFVAGITGIVRRD